MIRVDRTRVTPPEVLIAEGGRGRRETENACKSLDEWREQKKDPAKWSFKFAVYGHDEVKLRLTELFHGKCAYCESRYGATQPMDVEHWRPKARIQNLDGSHTKPAYPWLAAAWENLFPSCIDCNRRRRQIDALTKLERSIGKEDQFPLAPGTSRATVRGAEDQETPLLLNPCVDNPDEYLVFTGDGVLKPKGTGDLTAQKARASIDVYALNRSGLVLTRKEVARLIKLRVARIKRIATLLQEPDLPRHIDLVLDELVFAELRELARMRRSDQPYALMARQLIDRWMDGLTALGIPPEALATPEVPGRAE